MIIEAIVIIIKDDNGVERVYTAKEEWPIKVFCGTEWFEVSSINAALEYINADHYPTLILENCFEEVKNGVMYISESGKDVRIVDAYHLINLINRKE